MESARAVAQLEAALQAAGGIDLLRAAAGLGIIVEPELDVEAVVAAIEDLAASVERDCGRLPSGVAGIERLNRALFVERGWCGDRTTYDDPRNCFLHTTIARRTGLPITLALVYIEVGARLGLPLEGVGFPAQFLVRSSDGEGGHHFIDVFNEGRLLDRAELADFLRRRGWQQEGGLERFLAALTPRQILDRLLNNIKARYLQLRRVEIARAAVELKLVLAPWELDEVRDHGLLSAHLGDLPAAVADLETYLGHAGDAPDAARLRERLSLLRSRLTG